MSINTIKGNLLDMSDDFDVIIHGCNCFKTMGAGIALSIRHKFPEAFIADRNFAVTKPEDRLGKISFTINTKPVIVNAYTQFHFKRTYSSQVLADYNAIRSCMKHIKIIFHGKKIGMPTIGAGLAGGDWNIIKQIIDEELHDENVTIVEYDPPVKNSNSKMLDDLLSDFSL